MDDRQPDHAALVAQYLAGRSEPCPVCGYDLRDQQEARCPECGTRFQLHLHPFVSMPAHFLLGVFGLVLGLLFSLAAAAVGFAGAFWLVIPALTGSVVTVVHMYIWERRYQRLMRRYPDRKGMLLVSCWVVAVLSVVGIVVVVML